MNRFDPFGLPGSVEIIAHRGYSARAPENTNVAMERAIEAGADAVEFDLHAARDGTPVLFHDATLNRTSNGTGPVASWSAAQLGRLDAGSWFDPAFRGEPIPALAATLELIGHRVSRVYAEVKGYRNPEDLDRIVEVVAQAGLSASTVFISMDWEALDRIRVSDPNALIGYIVEVSSRAEEGIERATGDPRALLDYDARILLADRRLAVASLTAGIALATWTVNTTAQAAELLSIGVPRITTNEVGALRAWANEL